MIQVEASGRTRLIEGPVHHLKAHCTLRVMAGNQNSPERASIDPDGYIIYTLVRDVTYNICHANPSQLAGRTMTSRRVTSVVVDRQGKCWVGEPSNFKPVRTTDMTLLDRMQQLEDVLG